MPKYLAALTAAVAAGHLKVVPAILEQPGRGNYAALAERFGATDAELVVLALQAKSPLLTNERNLITATESLGGNVFDRVDLIHDLQAATRLSLRDVKTLIADWGSKATFISSPRIASILESAEDAGGDWAKTRIPRSTLTAEDEQEGVERQQAGPTARRRTRPWFHHVGETGEQVASPR